ncbi:MAG: hypothetical protein R2749_07155 [Acidimicrobiales bacterium]
MHPTVDEQLRGIGRLLEHAATGGGLAPASADALDEARRRLRRLEGSWAQVLPFLTADNRFHRRAAGRAGAAGVRCPEVAAAAVTRPTGRRRLRLHSIAAGRPQR